MTQMKARKNTADVPHKAPRVSRHGRSAALMTDAPRNAAPRCTLRRASKPAPAAAASTREMMRVRRIDASLSSIFLEHRHEQRDGEVGEHQVGGDGGDDDELA